MKRHKQRARVLKYGVRQYIYDVDIGSIMKKEKKRKRNEKQMKREETTPDADNSTQHTNRSDYSTTLRKMINDTIE